LWIEDSSMNSEKVILIFPPLKLIDLSGGVILTTSGGVSSFGPPEGD